MATGGKQNLLINVPYRMVRPRLGDIVSLGIGIEVYLSNYALDEIEAGDVREVGRLLADQGVTCTCHAPFADLSPGGIDRQIRHISKEKLKKAVEMGNIMGAKGVVCHGGYDRWRLGGHEELWLANSVETWTELLGAAGDMPLFVENVFEETPETILALLDRFKEKNLWFCFDTGHFNLFTKVSLEAWLAPLAGRLRELHIHDNNGGSDDHLPVGQGTFPFRELKRFLRSRDGLIFTAEASSKLSAHEALRCAREFLS